MVDVFTIAAYAEVAAAAVILGGIVFAVRELRRGREDRKETDRQRHRQSTTAMFTALSSENFERGLKLLYELPAGLSKKELEEQLGDGAEDVHWVLSQFENLATMVMVGTAPIDLVFHFFAPSILNTWEKLERYILDMRQVSGKEHLFLYLEWLAAKIQHMTWTKDPTSFVQEMEHWEPWG